MVGVFLAYHGARNHRIAAARKDCVSCEGEPMTRRLFSVYGDSISTFEEITPKGWSIFYTGEQREATGVQTPADTWWMQVINHFDGELLANAAWSGCVCEGNVFPQGASERRIAALEQDGKTPDDILIYIGINDYGDRPTRRFAADRRTRRQSLWRAALTRGTLRDSRPMGQSRSSPHRIAACFAPCTRSGRTRTSGQQRFSPGA